VVIGRSAGGLQYENVLAADILIDLDHDLAVGKLGDDCLAERNAKVLGSSGLALPVKTIRFSSAMGFLIAALKV
jgi:hypothetical protein